MYEAHYPQGDFGRDFPSIARRWANALSREELDPNEMRAVIADAERHEHVNSGISYSAFVTDMRMTYHRIWEHYLSQHTDFAPGEGRQ